MKTYQDAVDKLAGRQSRKLGNNTYLQLRESGGIAVKLHTTDVVTFNQDGTIKLDSGGWQTVTTKDRINTYSPALIGQVKGIWYVYTGGDRQKTLYYDGMLIDHTGTPLEPRPVDQYETLKRRVDREVSAYIKGFIQDIKENGLQDPGPGDCWYCSLKTTEGKTLGEQFHDVSHIISHISKEDRYYVPSLLWNALQRRGNPGYCWRIGKRDPEFFRTDLQRYFRALKPALVEYYRGQEEV